MKKLESLIPSKIEEYSQKYAVKEFKNREGEGVVAKIINKEENKEVEVLCGNNKLLKQFNIEMNVSSKLMSNC